jgi:anaerobic magnesium-protoporphyrin IX monomethyl ester cyclase
MNLLINPTKMVAFGQTPPPLGLLYMASMAETSIYDAAMLNEPPDTFIEKHGPKIVGVTMYTSVRHDALNILQKAKACGAKTIAGGPHVGTCWRQLSAEYPFIDHLVIGDGEIAWKSLCSGDHLPKILKMPVPDLDTLPLPAWEKVDFSRYPKYGSEIHNGNDLRNLPRISIVLGRGCNGSCSFCSTWWVNGRYRAHSSEWMRRHLDLLWNLGVRHLVFQDDCLTADRSAAIELCHVMQSYSFSWSGTTRADAIDDELAKEMVKAGCYELHFGVESGSANILKLMRKKIHMEHVLEARQICKNNQIKFVALMMLGYPYETDKDRAESLSFLDKLEPDRWSSYDETFILPGTALYTDCKKRKMVDDTFWLDTTPFYCLEGLRLVKHCTDVTNISTVLEWGPKSTPQDTPFNLQIDGNSAFWFKFNTPLTSTQHIMIADIILQTMHSESITTAIFPHTKLSSLLGERGSHKIYIFDGIRYVKQYVGTFIVI